MPEKRISPTDSDREIREWEIEKALLKEALPYIGGVIGLAFFIIATKLIVMGAV